MRPVKNVLANWGGLVVGLTITFLLSPFVVHRLGTVRYGVWGVVGGLVGYLGLIDLGVRVAVTRFVAHHDARDDRVALRQVVASALGLFLGGAALAAVLALTLAVPVPRWFSVPREFLPEATATIAIGGLTVGATLIGGVYGGVVTGLQRLTALNTIEIATELVRAAATWGALWAGGGLVDLALIQFAAVALRGMLCVAAVRRVAPDLAVGPGGFRRAVAGQLLRFGGWASVLHVSGVIIFSSDAVVIGALMPVAQVAVFVIAGNLIEATFRVLGGVSRALYPLVSARHASHGGDAAGRLLTAGTRLGAVAILPILVTFLVRGPTFIGLWMGPTYAEPSGRVLTILAIGFCGFASYQMLTGVVMAVGQHRRLVPAFLAEAACNIALSIVLGLATGVEGVAWATTLPRLVLCLAVGPWYARRLFGLTFRHYAREAWGRPFAGMLPFVAATVLVERLWPAASLFAFFAQVGLILPLALLGAWRWSLDPDERALAVDLARRALRRPLPRPTTDPGPPARPTQDRSRVPAPAARPHGTAP